MSDFLDVLSQRHAVKQFDPTASITRSEIENLVQDASYALRQSVASAAFSVALGRIAADVLAESGR